MKKITIFLVLLSILTVFVFAADDDDMLGLDVGAEVTFGDVADEVIFGVGPVLRYENSFENLDIYAKLKHIFNFDDPLLQATYLEGEVTYNFEAGPGVFSIIGWTVNDIYMQDGESAYTGFFEPSVKYAQEFDFGTLFVQPGFSVWYEKDIDDNNYNLSVNLGYYNKGFGAELKGWYNIDPVEDLWMYELFLNYEAGPVYVELDIYTDKEFNSFDLFPYIECSITKTVALWLGINFENVAGEGDTKVTPYIGAFYRF